MKTGRSLQEIAAELERQVESRKDYLAPQGKLRTDVIEGELVLDGLNGTPVKIKPHAHAQFSDHLGIPKKYYDRMLAEQPALLAVNINTWLRTNPTEARLVRTLDGHARAFLSKKFRALDNFELAQAVLPTLVDKGVQVMSAELTETRFYIKGILPSLSDVLPDGLAWGQGHNRVDGKVVAAITISNSDVGAGAFRVEPSVFTPWCTNLAALVQAAMKQYHVGRSVSVLEEGFEVFQTDTRKADDHAFWLKVRDVVQAAFSEEAFRVAIESIKHTTSVAIESNDLAKVVEVTVNRLKLTEGLGGNILAHLARGGDLTQWGLASAITRTANDAEDYEVATELEHAGGEVLALTGPSWEAISKAK